LSVRSLLGAVAVTPPKKKEGGVVYIAVKIHAEQNRVCCCPGAKK
jgi:hypothetical protein